MEESTANGFKILSNQEIYALSKEAQKKYWYDYKKYLFDEARAQIEKDQKEAMAFARKENEGKRKRENHIKYILAGQLIAKHKDTVRLLIRELAEEGTFTENEILGLREMAATAGMKEEEIPSFIRKATKKKTDTPQETGAITEGEKEA